MKLTKENFMNSEGKSWTKKFQASLLDRKMESISVGKEQQDDAKTGAFELLDAITKSGALSIDDASLHVILASSHFFDLSLLETVIQRNQNPIDRVERSALLLASVVHQQPPANLIIPSKRPQLEVSSRDLLHLVEEY